MVFLTDEQEKVIELVQQGKNVLVDACIGSGKSLRIGQKILAPNKAGYILLEDIKVGDTIFDGKGKPTKVLGVYLQGKLDVYRITFNDGTFIETSADHINRVIRYKSASMGTLEKFRNKEIDMTTEEIINEIKNDKNKIKWQYRIITNVIDYKKQDLILEPYLLGLLLGDGGMADTKQVSFTNSEKDIQTKIKKLVEKENDKLVYNSNGKCHKNNEFDIRNANIKKKLDKLGLMGKKSTEKFIPEEYIYNSLENRLKLIQGLMDTDGSCMARRKKHVGKTTCGCSYEFSTSSKKLAEQFAFLLRSVGCYVKINERTPHYTYKGEKKVGQKSYRLYISPPNEIKIVSSEKHLKNWKEQQGTIRKIIDIKKIGVDECICLKVDSKEHTFLVGENIVTHNTTSIQALCNRVPDKMILYLTYNKLLKVDAQEKIKNKNVWVTNYHGYAYEILKENNITTGVGDIIQNFLKYKPEDNKSYDILVIDEYQDIELEISEMLKIIKERNKGIQIVAVGDMCQKIYDKTTLNVPIFIDEFLGEHETVEFTRCFRISKTHADKLSDIWGKKINGVNKNCNVKVMDSDEVVGYLANKNLGDILCLGSLTGEMSNVLNTLESEYPDKFNKKTVYAKIHEKDGGTTSPDKNTAIFTTFDGSKGLERDTCVVFDWTPSYWAVRSSKPNTKYEILRNIFCVSASRGKNNIIFVENDEAILPADIIKAKFETLEDFRDPFSPSEMFDFKYVEDVERCYRLLDIKEIEQEDKEIIGIKDRDELIDLSPVIGLYQEAMFFKNYDIDNQIKYQQELHSERYLRRKKDEEIEKTMLRIVAFETKQDRYVEQVEVPFVEMKDRDALFDRLATKFKREEETQKPCELFFMVKDMSCKISGISDVIKDNIVYELKFCNELGHNHFLQCAMYVIMNNFEKGILWNTKTNKMYEVKIPNKKEFLDAVINCITKGIEKQFRVANDMERALYESKRKQLKSDINEQRFMANKGNWTNDEPSEAQMRFIRTIERRTGEIFEGKTKGDASRFISQWKDEM